MATKQELERALIEADKQGNTEDARLLASALANKQYDFSAEEMVRNIPGSAVQFGKDVIAPFQDIPGTVENIYSLGQGLAGKGARGIRDIIGAEQYPISEEERMVDAVGQFFKNRYGTKERALGTLMEDPVGVAGDVSTVLTGGAMIPAKMPGLLGKIAGGVEKVGEAINPINLAVTGPAKTAVGMATPKALPEYLYQSAAKIPTTKKIPDPNKLVRTALEQKIMPTAKGVGQLEIAMMGLEGKVDRLIKTASKSGKAIPTSKIFRYLDEAKAKVGGPRIGAKENIAAIDNVANDFRAWLKETGKKSLTPEEMQQFKRSAYERVNWDRGQHTLTPGAEEGLKAMGRGAKEALEEVSPGLKEANRQLGELIELEDPLKRAAGRIDRRNMFGIETPIMTEAGQALGGGPGAVTTTLMGIMDMPKPKAKLALTLERLRELGLQNMIDPKLIPTLTELGLWQAGREELQPYIREDATEEKQ